MSDYHIQYAPCELIGHLQQYRTPDKMRHRLKGFSSQMYKKEESHSKLHLHLCILFKMREEEITKEDSFLD